MIDLNDVAIFAKVAQLESFSRAARALGMPVSTVSRRVTALEDQLGATLIQRTTRRLSLTAQGQAYFSQCSEPLGVLQDAEQALTQAQREPEGLLRVSAPVTIGQEPFYAFVSDFLGRHPRVRIDLMVTNVFVDLIAENVDLALRFGALRDSTLVARRLGRSVRYLVCAPDYLHGRAAPTRPDDLSRHPCLLLNARNNEAEWELVDGGGRTVTVAVSGPVSARDHPAVTAFALRGHGVALLPSGACDGPIARGELVRLLPDWSSPPIFIHTVHASRRFLPTRLQLFLQALRAWDSPLWQPLR